MSELRHRVAAALCSGHLRNDWIRVLSDDVRPNVSHELVPPASHRLPVERIVERICGAPDGEGLLEYGRMQIAAVVLFDEPLACLQHPGVHERAGSGVRPEHIEGGAHDLFQ